jgi:hypothetical protein
MTSFCLTLLTWLSLTILPLLVIRQGFQNNLQDLDNLFHTPSLFPGLLQNCQDDSDSQCDNFLIHFPISDMLPSSTIPALCFAGWASWPDSKLTEDSGTCPFRLCPPAGQYPCVRIPAWRINWTQFMLHSVKDNTCVVLVTTALKTTVCFRNCC